MPELPELEIYAEILSRELIGKALENPVFLKPYLLKSFPKDYQKRFPAKISSIERKGKYLVFFTESDFVIAIHLMRSGRIRIQPSTNKPNKFTACTFSIADGRTLQIVEYGKEKMARLYIAEDYQQIPGIRQLGIDPFDAALTKSLFSHLLLMRKRRLKKFLTEQGAIAGIGNAYANEILWNACLSPFSLTTSLDETEAQRLLSSIRTTLEHAIEQTRKITNTTGPVKEHRAFLAIHSRRGDSCPRCSDTIRWVYDTRNPTYYCPTCQTRGKILKDRRTSKFLK